MPVETPVAISTKNVVWVKMIIDKVKIFLCAFVNNFGSFVKKLKR